MWERTDLAVGVSMPGLEACVLGPVRPHAIAEIGQAEDGMSAAPGRPSSDMSTIDEDFRDIASSVDLFTLGEVDPLEGLSSVLVPMARKILVERASALSQEQLLEGYGGGKFGKYGYHFSDLLEAPARWGYRDRDADTKDLARAVKRKDADVPAIAAPVIRAARTRFDFPTSTVGRWQPMHALCKTRVKLLSLAAAGEFEVAPEDRCVFSPVDARATKLLVAAGRLPVVPFRSKEKCEYRDPFSDRTKTAAPSYCELYMVAWAAEANARWAGPGAPEPIQPTREHILVKGKPWTIWGYLPEQRAYLASDKSGSVVRVVAHANYPVKSDGLQAIVPGDGRDEAPVPSLCVWAAKSSEAVKVELLGDQPEAAARCTLGTSVLADLFAVGGSILEDGSMALPRVSVEPGAYRLGFSRETYLTVTDGPPGPYHDVGYSDDIQASLCVRAEDTSEDPEVFEVDHEGWLRGRRGTLSKVLASVRPSH